MIVTDMLFTNSKTTTLIQGAYLTHQVPKRNINCDILCFSWRGFFQDGQRQMDMVGVSI